IGPLSVLVSAGIRNHNTLQGTHMTDTLHRTTNRTSNKAALETQATPRAKPKFDPSIFAAPALTQCSIDAIRKAITAEDLRLIMVEWYDPRIVTHAPWDMWVAPEDMSP